VAAQPLSESKRRQLAKKVSKADGLPMEMLLDMLDDDLRAMAFDFTDEEIEERMRDTDGSEYVACLINPSDHAHTLIEFLSNVSLADLESLARDPLRIRELLARDYLALRGSTDLAPDTTEAAEAATTDDRRLLWARHSWHRLTPKSRVTYLEIFERVAGEMGLSALLRLLGPE
jgi:hypothetical protein